LVAPAGQLVISPGCEQELPSPDGTKPSSQVHSAPPSHFALSPHGEGAPEGWHTPSAPQISSQPHAGRQSVTQPPPAHSVPAGQAGSHVPPGVSLRRSRTSATTFSPGSSVAQTGSTWRKPSLSARTAIRPNA
jgi:hypothetical protein